MDNSIELTGIQIAAVAVFGVTTVAYLCVAFLPCFPWNSGAMFFVDAVLPGAPSTLQRWAHMMARADPTLAIQTLRCVIQGATFICGSSIIIVFFSVFFKVATSYQHLMVLIIGGFSTCSLLFFIQSLRLIFHLGFVVMTSPKKKDGGNKKEEVKNKEEVAAQIAAQPTSPPPLPIHREQSESAAQEADVQMREVTLPPPPPPPPTTSEPKRVDSQTQLDDQGSPTSLRRYGSLVLEHVIGIDSDKNGTVRSTLAACLAAEANMSIEEHAHRIEKMVLHSQVNWALGNRALMFLIAPAFGLFGAVPLIVSSLTVFLLLLYLDAMLAGGMGSCY